MPVLGVLTITYSVELPSCVGCGSSYCTASLGSGNAFISQCRTECGSQGFCAEDNMDAR